MGGQVFSFSHRPGRGVTTVFVRLEAPLVVTERSRWSWATYADDDTALSPPWSSLAIMPDLVFDDGSRLSGGVAGRLAIDRYGFAATPSAQFSARWQLPEQWNADTCELAAWVGRTVVGFDAVLGDPSLVGVAGEARGHVEVKLEIDRPSETGDPVDRVDTRRGSHAGFRFSRGNTVPLCGVPHGFAYITPATNASDERWPYRPYVHDDPLGRRLEALQVCHQPSPWIGDFGVLHLMPFTGRPFSARPARRRHIRPDSEVARPWGYRADLVGEPSSGNACQVRVTATSHAAAFQIVGAGPIGVIIDQLNDRGELHFDDLSDGRVGFHGWVGQREDQAWGNAPRLYFAGSSGQPGSAGGLSDDGRGSVAGFIGSTAAESCELTSGDRPSGERGLTSPSEAASGDDPPGERMFEVRLATSYISVDQAQRNLKQEADWTVGFAELEATARRAWDQACSPIEAVTTGHPARRLADQELRDTIAADLYRLHLYPNQLWEDTGEPGAVEARFADVFNSPGTSGPRHTGLEVVSGRAVVTNGYWDTYRTVWPMLALLDPQLTGELLDGQLEQVRRGGWMARWSAPGYVDSMVGTSSDQIFADAAVWGVTGFDRQLAFESGWRNACEPSRDPRVGRAGIASARFTGVMPDNVEAGLSWTIEAAISDAALARFARQLATTTDREQRYSAFARYFDNRRLSYRQLFDPSVGFFRGRSHPSRPGFDPARWGGDYTETNAWGMSVSAVHDLAGLRDLYGGPVGLRRHLDRLFATAEPGRDPGGYSQIIHEQREARAVRAGMCAISNQPAHHIPYIYSATDQPWRAGQIVHDLAGRLFTGGQILQGYPGDEDNGQMSAWWLWALLGLYPLELASGSLLIGDPLADEVRVTRNGGQRVRIVSRRASNRSVLIAARLNGHELAQPLIPVDAFRDDVDLRLTFGEDRTGSALWASSNCAGPAPVWRPDLARVDSAVGSSPVSATVFDDGWSGREVVLEPGQWVGQRFGSPQAVTDLTLTVSTELRQSGFVVEAGDDGEHWQVCPMTDVAVVPPDRTTPFSLRPSPPALWWRLTAITTMRLTQVEFFALD
ncbi:MAG: GH92 family glycosyl hydrolase [Propionibacteriaceae bacterium]|nr:GH92 family glycosyl hydrolase [Propionibacteriaceae bacterium]